ncbi:unnamed protein product [Mytilus coruscus]|uniref:Uncharacterized protein n=1 Tax=Mytilus coruscus TaxID=42192 RepID=A0A6J8ES49_MYTCO|nr:unnamed protein product [Mytilus coruscus]
MLLYKDRSGHMDSLTTNTGAYKRRKFISSSKSVDLQGPLYHELFQMDRYLLNMTDVCLKLFRNKPSFCLMSDEGNPNYDIIIEDIAIKVRKIRVDPAIIYAHSLALQKSNAKYPYTKSAIKHLSLVKGSTIAILENLFQDVKPQRIIMGMTSSNGVNRYYQLNPWNFKNYDLQQVTIYCDGVPVGGMPLKLDFNEERGVTNVAAYDQMYESSGKWMTDGGNDITRTDFNEGYALFCLDLEPHFRNISLSLKTGKFDSNYSLEQRYRKQFHYLF